MLRGPWRSPDQRLSSAALKHCASTFPNGISWGLGCQHRTYQLFTVPCLIQFAQSPHSSFHNPTTAVMTSKMTVGWMVGSYAGASWQMRTGKVRSPRWVKGSMTPASLPSRAATHPHRGPLVLQPAPCKAEPRLNRKRTSAPRSRTEK